MKLLCYHFPPIRTERRNPPVNALPPPIPAAGANDCRARPMPQPDAVLVFSWVSAFTLGTQFLASILSQSAMPLTRVLLAIIPVPEVAAISILASAVILCPGIAAAFYFTCAFQLHRTIAVIRMTSRFPPSSFAAKARSRQRPIGIALSFFAAILLLGTNVLWQTPRHLATLGASASHLAKHQQFEVVINLSLFAALGVLPYLSIGIPAYFACLGTQCPGRPTRKYVAASLVPAVLSALLGASELVAERLFSHPHPSHDEFWAPAGVQSIGALLCVNTASILACLVACAVFLFQQRRHLGKERTI